MPFQRLVKGYKSFRKDYFRSGNKLYENLVRDGQSPETLVIACSDSRADPAIVLKSRPGDLFVIRNVAAIVPPYTDDGSHHGTSAGIEFAVRTLKVKHIVVMGHSLCGGIQALEDIENFRSQYEFLPQWVSIGEEARKQVCETHKDAPKDERLRALEQAVVLASLNNLTTFPWIKAALDAGEIDLHGWHFDLANGRMLRYDAETQSFEKLNAA